MPRTAHLCVTHTCAGCGGLSSAPTSTGLPALLYPSGLQGDTALWLSQPRQRSSWVLPQLPPTQEGVQLGLPPSYPLPRRGPAKFLEQGLTSSLLPRVCSCLTGLGSCGVGGRSSNGGLPVRREFHLGLKTVTCVGQARSARGQSGKVGHSGSRWTTHPEPFLSSCPLPLLATIPRSPVHNSDPVPAEPLGEVVCVSPKSCWPVPGVSLKSTGR